MNEINTFEILLVYLYLYRKSSLLFMPEPDNFSPTEQFQDACKKIWNKLIREYFRDIPASNDSLDLSVPRQALVKACLHKEDDQLLLTIGRTLLFLHGTTWLRNQYPVVAGTLLDEIDGGVSYRPKITLFFVEDSTDAEDGYAPVEMECSFRLPNETSTTISKSQLTILANKIKTKFGAGNGYVFRKGRKMINYRDRIKGYDFRLRSRELSDAKELIRDILALNGDTMDNTLLKYSQTDDEAEAYPYNPGSQTILGKRKSKPRRRPMTSVRFRYAYCTVAGVGRPVYLYSKYSYIPDVLVLP
jgi:hypothetical protein